MLHAVIMAGGAGTRFWPLSRADRPKQLLPLVGEETMIQTTVRRLGDLIAPDRVLVVTNRRLTEPIRNQLPELSADSVVGEPCKRDTAPCIGLAAMMLRRQDDDATMVVTPADHAIAPTEKFQQSLQYAARLIDQNPRLLVTFGVRPSYPAETFGYIQRGEPLRRPRDDEQPPVYRVARFREKPQAEVARQYIESGDFYWNSGIFVWKAETILQALARHEPEMYGHLETIGQSLATDAFASVLDREFEAISSKSIDYAVMEHYDQVAVIEAPFGWDDVGNWQSLSRRRGTDEQGNTIVGKHLGLETQGCVVRGEGDHLIVTLGLEDCIVVHTPDATLVARKDAEERIREVVKLLQEKDWKEYL